MVGCFPEKARHIAKKHLHIDHHCSNNRRAPEYKPSQSGRAPRWTLYLTSSDHPDLNSTIGRISTKLCVLRSHTGVVQHYFCLSNLGEDYIWCPSFRNNQGGKILGITTYCITTVDWICFCNGWLRSRSDPQSQIEGYLIGIPSQNHHYSANILLKLVYIFFLWSKTSNGS